MSIATPPVCKAIESQLQKLRQQLQHLNEVGEPDGPFQKPRPGGDPEAKRLQAEIRKLNAQLTSCIVQHTPANPPLTVTFDSLFCIDQHDTQILFVPESDEPYLIVYAVNIPGPGAPVPDGRAFLIGPMRGVDSGESASRPTNVWDTNGRAQPIPDPNKVILLVALLEEDDSGADYVRTAVQTGMVPILATNIQAAFTDPEGFRARLVEGMRGVIRTALNLFPLPPESADDLIGAVQQIRLTKTMLNNAIVRGSVPIPLSFTSSDAGYNASFRLRRA